MSVKIYGNGSEMFRADANYVSLEDYEALKLALAETLGNWKWFISSHDERSLKRIAALRAQFLES